MLNYAADACIGGSSSVTRLRVPCNARLSQATAQATGNAQATAHATDNAADSMTIIVMDNDQWVIGNRTWIHTNMCDYLMRSIR